MAEIAISFIAKLAEYLVAPLLRQGRYFCCAGNIKKTLENEKQELASKRDEVQRRVREALNRTEEINGAVNEWLAKVTSHMEDVQQLEEEMNGSSRCFQGRCPTWSRYCLSRKMTKMIEATEKLIKSSDFNPFSTLAPLSTVGYPSSKHFEYFESTKKAADQLLAALRDNDTRMIGLYGMGGSGKTTLVKEVANKVKELNLFDHVILATVSQTPNIRKIQGEIADMLSLKFEEESEVGRAVRLSKRLSNGERILLILDDVWSMINLEDVGIPLESCKVLLTTRLLEVCSWMDCKCSIQLLLLSEEESRTLFRKHAHVVGEPFESVAQEIVGECKGLPIAIYTLGASLKGKDIEEWSEALRRLKRAIPTDVPSGVEGAFPSLKLSYDCLRSNVAKSLFLMCSMYPEDADISIEDLFRIAVGLGKWDDELGFGSLEDARNAVTTCINNLVDSSLLMRSDKKEDHLRMHDVVRDVALWISSTQEKRPIKVNLEKDLKVSIKDCYAFTSWCHKSSSQFPRGLLDAPKLEILLLTNIDACELLETDFGGMGALKIMQIDSLYYYGSRAPLSLLPHSMNLLANLRTLRLQGWELGDDLSWLLGLNGLEVLDLKGSFFQDLPQGLEELHNLKLLDLLDIKEKSFRVIERCKQLQELYASTIKLSTEEDSTPGKCFPNDANFPRLRRYKCQIERLDFRGERDPFDFSSKSLTLSGLKISTSGPFIKYLLQQAVVLDLQGVEVGCKNIVPEIVHVVGGRNELAKLKLYSCSDLECLVDATSHHIDLFQVEPLFFPKLIKLKLQYLVNLKEIWRGPPLLCFFRKLQELYISNCSMLMSLFPKCVSKAELSLQKLNIKGCSELKNIIEEDADAADGANNEITSASENAHLVFSKLKSLTIEECDKLEYVFSNSCVEGLEQLEEVRIDRAFQLKYAFGQHEEENQEIQINLPVLKSLHFTRLGNMLSIFPKNLHAQFPCLTELHCEGCPKFRVSCCNIMVSSNTDVLQDNQLYNKASAPLSFPNLEELKVKYCRVEDVIFADEREAFAESNFQNELISPLKTMELVNLRELKFVWRGPLRLSLQNLKVVRVWGCNNLRTIFSPVIVKSMPLLDYLLISECDELEEVMSGTVVGERHDQGPLNGQSPQICFPNLRILHIDSCNKLKCLFSVAIDWNHLPNNVVFPNLTLLFVEQVPSLKEFFPGLSLSNTCHPQLFPSNLEELRLESPLDELGLMKWRQAPSQHNLRSLELCNCNKLKYVFGDEGIHIRSLSMLWSLTISNCEELEEILMIHDNQFQTCFPKLEYLKVEHCHKLKCVFSTSSSSLTTLLLQLYEIKISECALSEQLFRNSTGGGVDIVKEIMLPNLAEINLTKLPSLVDICKGFKLMISAVNIQTIKVHNCPKFASIIGPTRSIETRFTKLKEEEPHVNMGNQLLHQLPYLYPKDLNLKELELQKLSELSCIYMALTPSFQNLSFQYLEDLRVHGCGKLKCIFSMSVWGSLPSLEFLQITECEELEEIMQDLGEEAHDENVSNSNMQSPFPKLYRIKVKGCNKLKCLSRNVVVGMLPQLETIEVSECAQMEELFSHTTSHDEATTSSSTQDMVLPNLQKLKLSELPALTHFCKGFNLIAPKLRCVEIKECPQFDFSSQRATGFKLSTMSIEVIKVVKCPKFSSIMGPTGSIDTRFTRSKEEDPHANMGNQLLHQLPYLYPQWLSLRELELQKLSELSCIYTAFTHSFQNLSFQYLQYLIVHGCGKLKCIFSMSVWGSLPQLKVLEITECEELEEIIQDLGEETHHENASHLINMQLPFPKLCDIKVKGCNKLKCLLRNVVEVGMLPQLRGIEVSECAQIEELFSYTTSHDEATTSSSTQDMVLPNLRQLGLSELPALTYFCKGFNLIAPKLGCAKIKECPQFDFSSQRATEEPHANMGNLLLHQLPYFYPKALSLMELELQKLSELSCIYTAFTPSFQNLSFQYLGSLRVHGCGKLKCIFSMSVWGSLPSLEFLQITVCEELEEIMQDLGEEAHDENVSNSNMQSPFPKLYRIKVKGYNKLKCLLRNVFEVGMLPQLGIIQVSECAQMEELFSHTTSHDEATTTTSSTQYMVLPNLQLLALSELPALTHFCKRFNLIAPKLRCAEIKECPQFDFSSQRATDEGEE